MRRRAAIAAAVLLTCSVAARAGHSVGHYPSYYPSEILIDRVDPAAAAKGLADGTLQAYVDGPPAFDGPVPDHVRSVTSLGSFVVLGFDASRAEFASAGKRCAAARGILAKLREEAIPGFVFHPYPVTPYHADFLHHLDKAENAKAGIADAAGDGSPVTIHADGRLAESLIRTGWTVRAEHGDVTLEQVSVADIVAREGALPGAGPWPPLAKEGWYQAYRLLKAGSSQADEIYDRLVHGRATGLAEQADLERQLVGALTRDCTRLVAGYTLRREYANTTFSRGVENIAYDSQLGLNAPVFLRTVKLQEYPWNGTLRLGTPARAAAAWNPVAGFTDPAGRLIWSAVGDPAMIAFPDNASWISNRVHFVMTKRGGDHSGGVAVPPDALLPEPATGGLKAVGGARIASAKLVYEVLGSPFADGTEMEMADVLYPFVFAYRWAETRGPGGKARETRLRTTASGLRERLAGLRPVSVDRVVKSIAPGLDVVQRTPVLEVYLRDAPGDDNQIAAMAPPWSTLPWHLVVLMEEAVGRGYAAFSREEAARRGVLWLDLVRDDAIRKQLLDLTVDFERKAYRPAALEAFVTAGQARERWRALRTFAEENGHFLVTNGPYRLREWSADAVMLEAVREATYPLGFGSFDRYVNPPRGVIREAVQEGGKIVVAVDAELTKKVERHYEVEREPLTHTTSHRLFGLLVVSRYLLIAPDGRVLKLDKMHWQDDGRFAIDLPANLDAGEYTVLFAVFLDGNSLLPSTRLMRVRVPG